MSFSLKSIFKAFSQILDNTPEPPVAVSGQRLSYIFFDVHKTTKNNPGLIQDLSNLKQSYHVQLVAYDDSAYKIEQKLNALGVRDMVDHVIPKSSHSLDNPWDHMELDNGDHTTVQIAPSDIFTINSSIYSLVQIADAKGIDYPGSPEDDYVGYYYSDANGHAQTIKNNNQEALTATQNWLKYRQKLKP